MVGVTLRLNGREITLSSEEARALSDLLWQDAARGAVSAAAQILAELRLPDVIARRIDLDDHETSAVERALRLRQQFP